MTKYIIFRCCLFSSWCCRCAAMSWSVCVTWAGQETTVTPRLPWVIWWLDPLPQSQVAMLAPYTFTALSSSQDICTALLFFTIHLCLQLPPLLSLLSALPLRSCPLTNTLCWLFQNVSLLFLHAFLMIFSFSAGFMSAHSNQLHSLFFTEPCTSFFLFVIFFTLILCRQADVFDGVTWGQIWVPFHCICPVFDVIFCPSSSLTQISAHLGHYWVCFKKF